MSSRLAAAAILLLVSAAVLAAYPHASRFVQQAPWSASVSGLTVDQTTGRALPGVAVYVNIGSVSRETTSDTNGRFEFLGLPKGEASLLVRRDGWVQEQLVSDHPEEDEHFSLFPPRGVALADGQRIEGLRLGLRHYATLTGRVVDEAGLPVAGASVSAMVYGLVAGRQQLVPGQGAETDQQGIYRFKSLRPGDYVVTASVKFTRMREIGAAPRSAPFVFERRFYPDVPAASAAQTIAVSWGQALPPIDFTLRRGRAVRVSGQVTGAASFGDKAYVHLEHTDPFERRNHLFVAYATLDAQGNFRMAPVPPGRYKLTTYRAEAKSGRMLWTGQAVTVGAADVTGLKVPLHQGLRISGGARFDGASPKPTAIELERMSVALVSPDDFRRGDVEPMTGHVRPDGTFASVEMAAGRYIVEAWHVPQGWTLRSALVAGKDAADTPFALTRDLGGVVLTFTDRAPRLPGRVLDREGKPAAKAHVLIFPAAESLWTDFGLGRRLKWVTTGDDGIYEFINMPAGDYLIAAVPTVPARGWRDEAFLKQLATSATRVSLAEGNYFSLPLRLVIQ